MWCDNARRGEEVDRRDRGRAARRGRARRVRPRDARAGPVAPRRCPADGARRGRAACGVRAPATGLARAHAAGRGGRLAGADGDRARPLLLLRRHRDDRDPAAAPGRRLRVRSAVPRLARRGRGGADRDERQPVGADAQGPRRRRARVLRRWADHRVLRAVGHRQPRRDLPRHVPRGDLVLAGDDGSHGAAPRAHRDALVGRLGRGREPRRRRPDGVRRRHPGRHHPLRARERAHRPRQRPRRARRRHGRPRAGAALQDHRRERGATDHGGDLPPAHRPRADPRARSAA